MSPQSIIKISTLVVENWISCTFLLLKEGETFIISIESGIYELKHKHNNKQQNVYCSKLYFVFIILYK